MNKTMEKNRDRASLILLFAAAYFVSYLTRNNFAAIVVEVANKTGWGREALSSCFVGSFIAYGAGQVLSGYLGDRISPKKLIFLGLLTTSAMNCLLPFCGAIQLMAILWSVNGLAQAFLWPPMVRLMAQFFTADGYRKAALYVNYGGTAGTITLYLLSPFVLSWFGWKGVFLAAASCGILMTVLWLVFCPSRPASAENAAVEVQKKNENGGRIGYAVICFLCLVLAANAIQGALRDGVTTWAPSYIGESFGMQNQKAILVSVLLPILGFIGYGFSGWLNRRFVKDPVLCALLFFGAGLLSSVILLVARELSAGVSVIFMGLLVSAMYGANMMTTGMLPACFSNTGRISLISGLLNAFVYVGSAISTYGIAALSERAGWTVTIGSWAIMAAIGVLLCLFAFVIWKRGTSDPVKNEKTSV